jgi:hypothetical protein
MYLSNKRKEKTMFEKHNFLKSARRIFCIALLVIGIASLVSAQSPQICSLQGSVVDESNGLPIPIALITAQGISIITATTSTPLGTMETITTVTTITGTTTTDINGDYCFGNLPGGTYNVTANATGYVPETAADVVIVPGGTTTQDFSLTPEQAIKEVDINFEPETLNTNNKGSGSVVTIKVYPPDGYSADDIIPESVMISGIGGKATNIEPINWNIDNDGNSMLVLKYNRQEVLNVIRLYQLTGSIEITVTGSLIDTTPIIGADDVTVKTKK